ncbi:MAG: hypothetical protein ACLSAH_06765 [Bilophila wadsworthia]
MSQCCCLSPQEERLQGTKKVNRQGRERVYKILDRISSPFPRGHRRAGTSRNPCTDRR